MSWSTCLGPGDVSWLIATSVFDEEGSVRRMPQPPGVTESQIPAEQSGTRNDQ